MVACLSPVLKMKTRLRSGVRARDDVFGGICYVPHRDDFFAADKKIFAFIQSLSSGWREVPPKEVAAVSALASLGICETTGPKVTEASYNGQSLLGEFLQLPKVSIPIVVNCFFSTPST
jgi:hypothetical protein